MDDRKVVKQTLRENPNSALKQECDSDYVLESDSCWITVGKLSVYIKKTDDGVVVDIYPRGAEDCEAIASTYAFESEIENE